MSVAGALFTISMALTCLAVNVDGFPPNECLEQCTGIMQIAADNISNGLFDSLPKFSWSDLYQASQKPEYASQTYEILCDAYKKADNCLNNCQGSPDVATRVRQSYASLKIVCVDQKTEFLDILPCFVRVSVKVQHKDQLRAYCTSPDFQIGFPLTLPIDHPIGRDPKGQGGHIKIFTEQMVMEQCKNDITGTLSIINSFNDAVKERNQHHIQSSISNLCRNINQLAKCLEKPTTQYCGKSAADMVLRYIALGFSGFEILYEQMRITDQLPQPCLQLSSMGMNRPGDKITISKHQLMPKSKSEMHKQSLPLVFFISVILLPLHF